MAKHATVVSTQADNSDIPDSAYLTDNAYSRELDAYLESIPEIRAINFMPVRASAYFGAHRKQRVH